MVYRQPTNKYFVTLFPITTRKNDAWTVVEWDGDITIADVEDRIRQALDEQARTGEWHETEYYGFSEYELQSVEKISDEEYKIYKRLMKFSNTIEIYI